MCYTEDYDDVPEGVENPEGVEIDCPEDGEDAIFNDTGIHCSNPDCIYHD